MTTGQSADIRFLGFLILASLGCRNDLDAVVWQEGVEIEHYEVRIVLEPEALHMNSVAAITANHLPTMDSVHAWLDGMHVDSVTVNGVRRDHTSRRNKVVIPLDGSDTKSSLVFHYHGVPRQGVIRRVDGGEPFVFTESWPDRSQGWLPLLTHPAATATLDLSLTVPASYTAAASGHKLAVDSSAGQLTFRWQLREPAPTYTFAFAVAPYRIERDTSKMGTPISYYLTDQASQHRPVLQRTPHVLDFFSTLIGGFPFESYAIVEVPMRHLGMENASASFIQRDLLTSGRSANFTLEDVLIHETAHQWFGNAISVADWADVWISEGFSSYLVTVFAERTEGLDAARGRWVEMARLDRRERSRLRPLNAGLGGQDQSQLSLAHYRKAASFLHLLRRAVGDEAFFAGLRMVFEVHRHYPMTTDDLRGVMESVSGRDLEGLFGYWVAGQEIPTLKTSWNSNERSLTWEVVNDEGHLSGIAFEIMVIQGGIVSYVESLDGRAEHPEWSSDRPLVYPVGIMMQVE